MNRRLRLLHTVGDLDPRSGGTSRAVVDLSDALAKLPDVSVTVLYQTASGKDRILPNPAVRRVEAITRLPLMALSGTPLRRALRQEIGIRVPSLIHSHGLWLPVNHWTVAEARRRRIALVIQPHGMLEPWSLSRRAWKKRAAMVLFQRRDLNVADMFVASTEREYESFRRLGLSGPVVIVPHGVAPVAARSERPTEEVAGAASTRQVLFLSRLHPKKGLLNLLRAWARLNLSGWQLIVAGPDEGNHLREIQDAIRCLNLRGSVKYVGEVQGEVKAELFRRADLFALPTFSENFGIVVAEALAYGVPVITTRGTPWAELETHRCGWWIDVGEQPLLNALRDATALSDEARRAMGARGRELSRQYEWGNIARQLRAAYRWLLREQDIPDCVRTD